MSEVRMTIIKPRQGSSDEALEVLSKIDGLFAGEAGLLLSFVFGPSALEDGLVGRVSVWDSRDAANKAASSGRVLALRARLQKLTDENLIETLSELHQSPWAQYSRLSYMPSAS
jgi:hypothetical protein